jgi:hypothetical protein
MVAIGGSFSAFLADMAITGEHYLLNKRVCLRYWG